jgi:hypothetical protein
VGGRAEGTVESEVGWEGRVGRVEGSKIEEAGWGGGRRVGGWVTLDGRGRLGRDDGSEGGATGLRLFLHSAWLDHDPALGSLFPSLSLTSPTVTFLPSLSFAFLSPFGE